MNYIRQFCFRAAIILALGIFAMGIVESFIYTNDIKQSQIRNAHRELLDKFHDLDCFLDNTCSKIDKEVNKIKFDWEEFIIRFVAWIVALFSFILFCFAVRYIFTGKLKINKP